MFLTRSRHTVINQLRSNMRFGNIRTKFDFASGKQVTDKPSTNVSKSGSSTNNSTRTNNSSIAGKTNPQEFPNPQITNPPKYLSELIKISSGSNNPMYLHRPVIRAIYLENKTGLFSSSEKQFHLKITTRYKTYTKKFNSALDRANWLGENFGSFEV